MVTHGDAHSYRAVQVSETAQGHPHTPGRTYGKVRHHASLRHHASPERGPVALADLVADIVERARRLRAPSARNPEQFHEDKGELVGALVDLQHRVREGRR